MNLYNTLTSSDIANMLAGQSVALFKNLEIPFDDDNNIALGYYMYHSGRKKILDIYQNLIDTATGSTDDDKKDYANAIMVKILNVKYADKWSREWAVLNNLEDVFNTKVNDFTDVDTITYGSETENDETVKTKLKTINKNNSAENTYGFNSPEPAPLTSSGDYNVETVEGSDDDNVTHSEGSKKGSDVRVTERKGGGREGNVSDIVNKEINLREKNIMIDVIYRDIDKVVALSIY